MDTLMLLTQDEFLDLHIQSIEELQIVQLMFDREVAHLKLVYIDMQSNAKCYPWKKILTIVGNSVRFEQINSRIIFICRYL